MPSPRPSPMGREKYGAQVRRDALTPALSHGEREKNGAQVRSDALTPTLSHGEREKYGAQVRRDALTHGERERGRNYFAFTLLATSSAVNSINVPEITSGEVSPIWSSAIPPTAAPQVFAS